MRDGSLARQLRIQSSLVAAIGLVAFVGHITNQVGPGDSVGSTDKLWMCYGPKAFTNIRGVGHIALSGKKGRPDARGICGIPNGAVCGFWSSARSSVRVSERQRMGDCFATWKHLPSLPDLLVQTIVFVVFIDDFLEAGWELCPFGELVEAGRRGISTICGCSWFRGVLGRHSAQQSVLSR